MLAYSMLLDLESGMGHSSDICKSCWLLLIDNSMIDKAVL